MTQIDIASPDTEYHPVATRPLAGVTMTFDGDWVLADETNDTAAFISVDDRGVVDTEAWA